MNLVVKPGDHIGIIGPSGAGKSTLAQILLRLRSPSSGTYVINGRLVDDYADLELRDKISLVPQQTVLFRGTVHDNIAFYRADVERTTVIDAAQRAGVHEAIMALPLAYDTLIGRAHRELSGGQTQRLGIARALLGRPSILVLDEPTSALDVDSEELITATLRALPNDVIVLVIAHRVSTLRDCNRVVVLEKGRIVADTSMSDAAITNQFFRRALEAGVFGQ